MRIDVGAFARDLTALKAELDASIGEEDLAHFKKLERWGRTASALGWATAWIAPNPVSSALIALGNTARWTIVTHHVSHRGLDKVPNGPRSATYAKGNRRWIDWLDWLHPESWAHEHNVVHHYRTGETADADLVEHNMRPIRESSLPRAVKWGIVGFYAFTWRLTYYAPNAWQVFRRAEQDKLVRRGQAAPIEETTFSAFDPRSAEGRGFLKTLFPYAFGRFVVAPAAFLPLGPWASFSVLMNSLAGELLTNLYTFVLIAPNHAGDDLYRFDAPLHDRGEFYLRQVVGSASYTGGTDVKDFFQGFLNYQIEHHLWPDLPPLKYQQAQPKVQAICEKHGVPYVRESVFTRVRKLLSIMVGDTSMLRTADARSVAAAPAESVLSSAE